MFGTPSTPSPFGTPSTPGFGATPGFGTASSAPLFGTPSTPAFGATPAFGTPSSTSLFGTPSTPAFGATPAFGTPSTPAFGTPSSTPAFGTPSSTPAFGTPSTPAFGSTSFFQPQQQQQQGGFSLFPQQQQQPQQQFSLFPQQNAQITTQMAPVAPISMALADRDLTALIDAYKAEPGNPKYSFRHLLFSVTDQAARVKPVGASDIMWAEAMAKLEGMRSSDRDRLWPQLVQGFKELSDRLKLQDEVIVSDAARLKTTQTNVKLLTRHLQTDAIPRGQRLKHTEQALQRRLLRVMRIVEALDLKGFRLPLTKDEVELADKLVAILKKLKGPGGEVSRVHNLLAVTRVHSNGGGIGSVNLSASAKIDEQSLAELQDVLQQQTEAIARLGMILKRDTRDIEIIMPEGSNALENGTSRPTS